MSASPDSAAEDIALMLAVKRGETGAFTALVERWQQPILHFIYRMLPDQEEAEDLAQNVFVQLWRTADRYEPAARFSTFLFTIARNLCLNELRRRNRHPADRLDAPISGDDGEELGRQYQDPAQRGAGTEAESRELFTKVDEAVADLPEKQRLALALCRDGELSYEEIAAVVELTVPATKSLIFRAREVLRRRLKAYLGDGSWTPHDSVPPGPGARPPAKPTDNFPRSLVMNPTASA